METTIMTTTRSLTIWLALPVQLLAASGRHADDAETQVVQAIEKLDGWVIRDEKATGNPVIEVHLRGGLVTDAILKKLAALKQLRTLRLENTQVTDAGLKELAALKQLRTLDLWYAQVT